MESDHPKRPYCTLHDFEINYKNLSKIQNCESHQTFKQNKEKWNLLAKGSLK